LRGTRILVLDQDDDFAEQVRKVGDRLRADVVACPSVEDAAELNDEGPFDLLIGGPGTETQAGMARLEALRAELRASAVVLAFRNRPESTLRLLVRTGAVDLLRLPVSDEALEATIERALDISQVSATHPGPRDGTGQPDRTMGRVFTVSSASGGAGKTFYCTNLAYFLHTRTGARTCILDLDLQFGEVAVALRLQPRYTISDILDRDDGAEQPLEKYIDEYVAHHETGIDVLAAPKRPPDADRVQATHVARVLEALRCRFDYVIVDTPAALTETVLTALELSDVVHVLVTLDVPALRNMSAMLHTLDQLGLASEHIRLVLNKVERDLGVDTDQLAKLFPQGFLMELPYVREVTKSLNLGTPMLSMAPTSEISRCMEVAFRPLLPQQSDRDTVGNGHQPGFLARLLRRWPVLRASSS
jgi:pilus assembly protein CpaE